MKVIVIGGLHHNTLGVIRSLGEAKVAKDDLKVLLVGARIKKDNYISKCKYVSSDNIKLFDSDDLIVDWLNSNNSNDKPCIICCSDGTAEAVMKNHDVLSCNYLIPSISKNIEKVMEKDYQNELAKNSGMKIPETMTIDLSNKKELDDWNIFPCITKPIKSVDGNGKGDIKIAHNREELRIIVDSIAANRIEVQQYINKIMEFQLIGCSIDAGKTIIIPGYTNVIRQPHNTNTGYLKYESIEFLNYDYSAVKRFLEEIGYNGLFSAEFIRDENGVDYFLEINLRNDGNAYCVQSAGVNLPYLWCFYLVNQSLPDTQISIKKEIHFMPEFTDLHLGIKEVGLVGWFLQFIFAESHAILNKKDIKPFFFQVKNYIQMKIKRLFGL